MKDFPIFCLIIVEDRNKEVRIIENFDINNLTKPVYHIGKLNSKVIEILQIELGEADILLGVDKIKYIEKHKYKFKSDEEYKRHVESVPDIIANPDYIAVHPTGQSIEYIKQIDEIMIVAVRVRAKGVLWVKSVFPISKQKLETYIRSGSTKKYEWLLTKSWKRQYNINR